MQAKHFNLRCDLWCTWLGYTNATDYRDGWSDGQKNTPVTALSTWTVVNCEQFQTVT